MKRFLSSSTIKAGLIGAPFNLGQRKLGVELGPNILRKNGIFDILKKNFPQAVDLGDIECDQILSKELQEKGVKSLEHKPQHIAQFNHKLQQMVSNAYSDNKFILTVGGDHSIGMGSVFGALANDKDVGVIWVDAHADINTPSTSPSLNYHGMPVSFLTGLHKTKSPDFDWINKLPKLKIPNLVFIGLRDVDSGEKELLRQNKILSFSMHDIDKMGIKKVMDKTLTRLIQCKNIHMSFDIDSLDPDHAPSTGTPVKAGLNLREGRYICERVRETNRLHSMDLVEVNPKLGENGDQVQKTVDSALFIVESATGENQL